MFQKRVYMLTKKDRFAKALRQSGVFRYNQNSVLSDQPYDESSGGRTQETCLPLAFFVGEQNKFEIFTNTHQRALYFYFPEFSSLPAILVSRMLSKTTLQYVLFRAADFPNLLRSQKQKKRCIEQPTQCYIVTSCAAISTSTKSRCLKQESVIGNAKEAYVMYVRRIVRRNLASAH